MNWEKDSLLYDIFPWDIRSHHLINAFQDLSLGKAGKRRWIYELSQKQILINETRLFI